MGETSPRALVLRTLVTGWGMTPDEVAALADGGRHAPEPLIESELARRCERDTPGRCAGRQFAAIIRSGSQAQFERAFGARAAEEGAALARARAGRPQGKHAEGRRATRC